MATHYNPDWEKDARYSLWVKPHPSKNKTLAWCDICQVQVNLSNMGFYALNSHALGKKHIKKVNAKVVSVPLPCLLENAVPNAEQPGDPPRVDDPISAPASSTSTSASSLCTCICTCSASRQLKTANWKAYLFKDEVTKAEVLWCLECVMSHSSLRGAEAGINSQKRMYPDSEICGKMQLSKAKIAYTIVHGISPYFQRELLREIDAASHIVIGYDESLNKISQLQQMDLSVRFWCTVKDEVSTRYLTSVFLGHTTASDIIKGFNDGIRQSDLRKTLHLSMDGPNVNFKVLRDLKASLSEGRPDAGVLLDMGSCGLHTMHCAFKAGVSEVGWAVVPFLRAAHNLFYKVPARRADFTRITESQQFPKKFCAHRWLENQGPADAAIELLPDLQTYVDNVRGTASKPKCKSFQNVVDALSDKLIGPKLAFFSCVASEVSPFLREFQSDHPLAPFLYDSLITVMHAIMSRFVKGDILKKKTGSELASLDVTDQANLLPAKSVNIGFGASAALSKVKLSQLQILQFREDCKKVLSKLVVKLQARSPLAYSLTKGISCLDPATAATSNGARRLTIALKAFVDAKWFAGNQADRIHREYQRICGTPEVRAKFLAYRRTTQRLDHFWMQILKDYGGEDCSNLSSFCKMVLIMSHGNASLERGFSINKECLVENQSALSLIAQRTIYDTVTCAGGIETFQLSKPLIHAARNAHSNYKDYLEKEKRKNAEKLKECEERKRRADARKELEAKRRKVEEEYVRQKNILEEQLKELH